MQKPFSEVLTQQNIEARVEALYTKIHTSLNHKLKSDATATEQSAQAAIQKDSDIIGQPPDQLLNQLVDRTVAARLNEAGIIVDNEMVVDEAINPAAAFVEAVRPTRGKVVSPPAGVGHNAKKPKPRGKGKGKSKAELTGKSHAQGSGKGQHSSGKTSTQANKSTAKGKAKGDAKGKSKSKKGGGKDKTGAKKGFPPLEKGADRKGKP